MVQINEDAFKEIDAGLSEESRHELEQTEAQAFAGRVNHPDAMDVYDVKLQKRKCFIPPHSCHI